ncbi:MAG: hypothetical protein AAB262_12905 [Elusimicrobiota bacterium]
MGMKVTTKRRGIIAATAVKRAVSLPRRLDETVQRISKENHLAYSAVVRKALDSFIENLEEARLEESYRSYYRDEKIQTQQAQLSEDFFAFAKEHWPGT